MPLHQFSVSCMVCERFEARPGRDGDRPRPELRRGIRWRWARGRIDDAEPLVVVASAGREPKRPARSRRRLVEGSGITGFSTASSRSARRPNRCGAWLVTGRRFGVTEFMRTVVTYTMGQRPLIALYVSQARRRIGWKQIQDLDRVALVPGNL